MFLYGRIREHRLLKMEHLYVLRCTGGRYYIGKSADVDKDIARHFAGEGGDWTTLFPPTSIYAADYPRDREMELMYDLMRKFGVKNVRSYQYPDLDLSKEDTDVIVKELRRERACIHCSTWGHSSIDCPKSTVRYDEDEPW